MNQTPSLSDFGNSEMSGDSAGGERRRHTRFAAGDQVKLTVDGQVYNCSIRDVSAVGVCLAGAFPGTVDGIADIEHPAWGCLRGKVVRATSFDVALQFDLSSSSVRFAFDILTKGQYNR